jgi:UDP-N-acetylglucosamine 2-epimerase
VNARLLFIFGTRPEAIKLAPLIQRCRQIPGAEVRVCVTGQHRTMLDQVLALFEIAPDYDLDLMRENQTLFQVTGDIVAGLEGVLEREQPSLVIVQGDTTTCFAASLAAYYARVPIGHVEAGLRTSDKYSPFPEEMNRRMADAMADLCFAPTETARRNLLAESIPCERVWVTGNTIVDALNAIRSRQDCQEAQANLGREMAHRYGIAPNGRTLLVTGHRRESFGKEMESVCLGLRRLAEHNPDVQIVYPVHLNPNVQKAVTKTLNGQSRVRLTEPLDYYHLVWLMSRSYLVITDSGGIQEEAPSLGVPVLVTRKVTERPEGVAAGVARLVGADGDRLFAEAQRLLDNQDEYKAMAKAVNPYGDGRASERIAQVIADKFSLL